MARKVKTVVITAEGRDVGKTFVLTEMSASRVEKWATRALLALSRSGTELPEDVKDAGLAGIAVLGLRALSGIEYHEAEALLDEMFQCVQVQPSPGIIRPLIEDDIEEVSTRVTLRSEVFTLHTGFSIADVDLKLTTKSTLAQPSQDTQTYPERLVPRSVPAKQPLTN